MHSFRARVALRSIVHSFCKSKRYQHGTELLSGQFNICRTLNTTTGIDLMDFRAKSTKGSMQKQIVDALRLGERKRAQELLLGFGHGSHSLRADDFVDIFSYCARSPDPLFAMETWRFMEARDISLNDICSFLMMQALCKGGYLNEAFDMMNFLGESQHLNPILPLYNSFLGACTKLQSLIHASKCLDLMEKQMVGKNEVTYIELLKLAVFQKNLSAVHQIWKDYVKHYSMSVISLHKFIWSFSRLGDLTSAYKTLQQMVSLAIRGNISIYKKPDGELCSTRLDIPVPSNRELDSTILDLEEDKQLDSCVYSPSVYFPDPNPFSIRQSIIFKTGNEEYMGAEMGTLSRLNHRLVMWVLLSSFNDVIHTCGRCHNIELAEQLMLQMQNLGLQPSSYTYDGFIRAVISQRGCNDGLEVLKVMQQNNMKPNDSTLAALSVSCSKALEVDLAEILLYQISKCSSPHPYNAFLASCDIMNKPERAVRAFAKMKQIKLTPDIRTYELLFSLYGNVNAPYEEGNMLSQVVASKRINAIERDMAKNGIQHSHLSMKNLLKALGEEGMIRELIQYLHVAENVFIQRDFSLGTAIYNIVLHSLVEANKSHLAVEIFKKMILCGCQPNAVTYNIMIDCCSIVGSFSSACGLVSMMIRNGFYPRTPTYTALIKILLKDEKFNEALKLLDQARSDGMQLDVLLFNTILQRARGKGRIDVIEFVVECMRQERIKPDAATCNYVFSAYVDSGFHNTAIEALQVLSMRMVCEDDDIFKEKKEFVEELILSEDLAAESQILKLFEDSEENLATALLNLRWCAIAGFPICGSADESPWTKRLIFQQKS